MPYHCTECDSEDVGVMAWVNPNTGRSLGVGLHRVVEDSRSYCRHCTINTGLVFKDEFEEDEIDQDSINDDRPGEGNQ